MDFKLILDTYRYILKEVSECNYQNLSYFTNSARKLLLIYCLVEPSLWMSLLKNFACLCPLFAPFALHFWSSFWSCFWSCFLLFAVPLCRRARSVFKPNNIVSYYQWDVQIKCLYRIIVFYFKKIIKTLVPLKNRC